MLHHHPENSCRKKMTKMVVTYWLNDRNFGVNNFKMIVSYNFSRGGYLSVNPRDDSLLYFRTTIMSYYVCR